jgi:hypothetical protein
MVLLLIIIMIATALIVSQILKAAVAKIDRENENFKTKYEQQEIKEEGQKD